MQTVSSTYQALLAANAAKEVKAVIAGTTYEQDKLVSVKTSVALMQGLAVGNAVSAQLDLVIHNPGTIPRMAEIDLYVRLNDGTTQSEWLPKGVYFIDTREYDETADQLTIHAYDAMLKTEQSFTQAGSQGEWPRTDIAVVKEIAYRIGLSTSASATDGIDSRTLAIITNGYAVQYPGITLEDGTPQYSTDGAYSMREVLGYIGVMYGGNWCISDAGKLRLVPLSNDMMRLEDAFYFSSSTPFTLATTNNWKLWDGTMEWTDGEHVWKEWNGETISSGTNHRIYLRGNNNTFVTKYLDQASGVPWILTGSDVSCNGDIDILLDWKSVKNGLTPTMAAYAFFHWMDGCPAIVNTPKFKTNRDLRNSEYCYSYMFHDCSNLKFRNGASVPRGHLSVGCCSYMFAGCVSITNTPALDSNYDDYPASCCEGMFMGCTNLKEAIALLLASPNTTVGARAFYSMYEGCTSVAKFPKIYVRSLSNLCFSRMFYGCSKVKIRTTSQSGYSTYRIPASGTGTDTSGTALTDMFTGTLGDVTTPSLNATYYASGVFN